jgi:hypothetical protein
VRGETVSKNTLEGKALGHMPSDSGDEELSLLLGGIDLTKTKHKRWYRKVSPEGHTAA